MQPTWTKWRKFLRGLLGRDATAGALAGAIGGGVSGGAGFASDIDGLLGLELSALGMALHVLISIGAGSLFGSLFRHQPGAYAALISNSLLYALLLWALGPLTLAPLLDGASPTWSAGEAHAAFSSLIVHLVFGGLTGFGFYVAASLFDLYLRPLPSVSPPTRDKTRVIVLGGGFGGISTAQGLEQALWCDTGLEIMLLSQSNYLLFTPMLAEVAASALEPQHISSPLRAALPHTQFHRCEVEAIDTTEQTVTVRDDPSSGTTTVRYDHLVLALGSIPNYFALPGLEENAFTLKTLEDATRLRNHVITQLERADVDSDPEERRRQLTFVVAGGGFAGTEMIAELFDLVHSVLRYYPNVRADELRFVLVHSRDRILPEIGDRLADYALRKLKARGIEFALNARVAGATPDAVLLGDGSEIPARTVVWTAGNQPNPILGTLPCERNRAGAVVAESTLQLKGFANVWVVGDCGEIPDPDREGRPYPPTAQHAIREGKTAARNIAAALQDRPPKQFRFRAVGMLVPLGHRTGVAEIRGLRFSGFLAWFMWRGIYLTLLPGLEKKIRVLFDWVIDLFFPRDIVLTGSAQVPTVAHMIQPDRRAGGDPPQTTPVERRERDE